MIPSTHSFMKNFGILRKADGITEKLSNYLKKIILK